MYLHCLTSVQHPGATILSTWKGRQFRLSPFTDHEDNSLLKKF